MSLISSVKYLFNVYLLRRRRLIAKAKRFDLSFNIMPLDVVGRSIYKKHDYESEITDYLLRNVPFAENEVFVDIGANIGWYSLLLSKSRTGPARVLAFEPDPLNYTLLSKNIEMNDCKNVQAYQFALSDTSGDRILYKYSANNRGRHSLLPINHGEQTVVHTISL